MDEDLHLLAVRARAVGRAVRPARARAVLTRFFVSAVRFRGDAVDLAVREARPSPPRERALALLRLISLLKRSFCRYTRASWFASNHSKNSSQVIGRSLPSPENPGKSMRRIPG